MPAPRSASTCVALYLEWRAAEGLKPRTLAAYRAALDQFLGLALPDDVRELEPRHAVAFLASLQGRGLKPGAAGTYQRAVWTWLRWLYDQDFVLVDISRKVKRVRVPEETVTRRTASEDALDRMVACAAARPEYPYRNVALLRLLWGTGVRRGELAAAELADIDIEHGTIAVRHSKTGRARIVGVDEVARVAALQYRVRERGDRPGPLFISRGGLALSSNAIRLLVQSLARSAGVTVSSHDFRRACAARMLRQGAPLDVVMHQLGHQSPRMSLTYGAEGRAERSVAEFHRLDSQRPATPARRR